MKIRKDWPKRLWRNRWWVSRAVMAFVLLAPLFVLEWVLARVRDVADWTAEQITEIGCRWSESEFLSRFISRVMNWVGKPEKAA